MDSGGNSGSSNELHTIVVELNEHKNETLPRNEETDSTNSDSEGDEPQPSTPTPPPTPAKQIPSTNENNVPGEEGGSPSRAGSLEETPRGPPSAERHPSDAPNLTRLPSQQQISRQESYRADDVKVLQLLDMGFPRIQAEIAVARLAHDQAVEHAVQALLEPPPDLQRLFDQADINEIRLSQIERKDRVSRASRSSLSLKMELELDGKTEKEVKMDESSATCLVCMDSDFPEGDFFSGPCGHGCCKDCWFGHYNSRISGGAVQFGCVGFSDGKSCDRAIPDEEILELIKHDEQLVEKFHRFKKNLQVSQNPNIRWCVKPGCETSMLGSEADPKLVCQECAAITCWNCKEAWHEGAECSAVIDAKFDAWTKKQGLDNVQKCPMCQSYIEKNAGCNHMTCESCRYEFCWLCRRKYEYNHYDGDNINGCAGMQFTEDPLDEEVLSRHAEQAALDAGRDKEVYEINLRDREERARRQEEVRARERELRRAYESQMRCRWLRNPLAHLMQLIHIVLVPLTLVLFAVFSILAVYHVDTVDKAGNFDRKHLSSPMSWSLAWPLATAIGIGITGFSCYVCGAPLISKCFRWREMTALEQGYGGPIAFVLDDIDTKNVCTKILFGSYIPLVFVFLILLLLQITGTIEISPVYVMLPLLISAFIAIFLGCVYQDDLHDEKTAVLGCFFCLSLSFLVLVTCWLVGEIGRMTLVFIPIYILMVLAVCGVCVVGCATGDFPSMMCFFVCCFGPCYAFGIMYPIFIDNRDSTTLTWWTTFTPLFLFESFLVILTFGAIVVMVKKWRSERMLEYQIN